MKSFAIDSCLDELEETLPAFLSPQDLIDLGLAGSRTGLATERKSGKGMPYVKIGRRIRYSRDVLLSFLRENMEKSREKENV